MNNSLISKQVNTPNGRGVVVCTDPCTDLLVERRYGVELETNPFAFSPVYYWENELIEVTE